MKLSIITTIYKAEKDLPRLLDSMMAQNSLELEFFLIDNGSPDNCRAICYDYAARDSRFVVYTLDENIGYIGARNQGLSVVDGDYIGFCDSDDFLEPHGYDHAIDIIKKYGCDLYLTSWNTICRGERIVNDNPYQVGYYRGLSVKNKILPSALGPVQGKGMLHGFAWKQIFSREIASRFRFMDVLKPYEDQIFNIDVIKVCNSVYVDNIPIYNYIVNDDSITAKLVSNFDIHSEWKRITLLYQEKKKRISLNNDIETKSIANDFFLKVYSLVLNEIKFSGSLLRFESLLQLDRYILDEVFKNSSRNQGFRINILKFCIKYRLLGILSRIIKSVLK